ncbi:acyltransferase [Caldibacillus lycopersici]|uniref:Acyltransferase n=1 Tax=Perspicuibacillus lycopersici TaxID=1325689 RepID=A0AAE3LST7_9BACI|nr:acyltransferase [Perspicuibacillus lycopersici]MCU9613108.1 acyltransferase [Perspicuibacillus lycopersici]
MNGERVHSLDFIKFFAIIFVVCIHSNPLENVDVYKSYNLLFFIETFGRFAVPFFFVTSGFLIGQKMLAGTNANQYFKKSIGRIVGIFLTWTAVYFVYDVITRMYTYFSSGNKTDLENYLHQFFQLDTILYGPNGTPYHLWYLVAFIWSLVILFVFIKLNKVHLLLLGSFVIHLIGNFGQSYAVVIDLEENTRNAVFFASFYLTLGYCIGFHLQWIRARLLAKINPWIYCGLFFTFSIAQAVERIYLQESFGRSNGDYYLSTALLVLSLFFFVLSMPNLGKNTRMASVGKNSLGIYVIHLLFLDLTKRFVLQEWPMLPDSLIWQIFFTPALIVVSYFSYQYLQYLKKKPIITQTTRKVVFSKLAEK